MVKRAFILLLLPFLLYLFIAPGRHTQKMSEQVRTAAAGAMDSAYREDWETVLSLTEQLNADFSQYKTSLQLFMNHKDVAELESALHSGLQLARVQEKGQFLVEMERAILLSDNLAAIERLNIYGLL